jgi:predicted kinase
MGVMAEGAHVVLMCGVAGAGKTAYSTQLEQDGFVRLSIDEEMWLRHGATSISSQDRERLSAEVEADLRARLVGLVTDGCRVVVDLSFWQRSTRDAYKRIIEQHGGSWDLVYLRATAEVLHRRLDDRSHACGPNAVMVDPTTLERYLAGFEEPSGEGETVVDQR